MTKPTTIGFITPPAWYEPAVTEFPTVVEQEVRVQQAPLLYPEFDFSLRSIAATVQDSQQNARCLAAMECDLVAQIGTPFAWAGTNSEAEARARCQALHTLAGVPCVMTGLALVDALRALGADKVAVHAPYYGKEGRQAFVRFLEHCGIEVLAALNLHDLGLIHPDEKLSDYWNMSEQLTKDSFLAVAEACPQAQAIVIPGTAVRTLPILAQLEERVQRPVIAADTVIYWAIARELGLTLRPMMGRIARYSTTGNQH